MKYFLSMLAVLALVGGGCVGAVENEHGETTPAVEVEIEAEDGDDAEESDDSTADADADEVVVAQEVPVADAQEQAPAPSDTQTEGEETTIDLGGAEITIIEEVTDTDEAVAEEEVQVVEVVLGGGADINLDMVSGNFFFEPSSITAAPGESIKITFTENSGFHTFVIDELDLSFSIEEGEGLKFTAPTEPGSYAFYCDIGSHRAFGMEGTLIVQ